MNAKLFKATLVALSTTVSPFALAANPLATIDETFAELQDPVNGFNYTGNFQSGVLSGAYDELVTVTGAGAFSTQLVFDAGQWTIANDIAGNGSFLGNNPASYDIYGIFTGAGTITQSANGANTINTFTFTSGSFMLYADIKNNAALAGFVTTYTPDADDKLIAYGNTVLSGSGSQEILPNGDCKNGNNNDCGSFGVTTNLLLTAFGEKYFTGPRPFFTASVEAGNFSRIDVSPNGVTRVDDAIMNVTFKNVPEPASLALLGIGALGFSASRRKVD